MIVQEVLVSVAEAVGSNRFLFLVHHAVQEKIELTVLLFFFKG